MILTMLLGAAVPACLPAQIHVVAGGDDGDFNGMSHSGTYLTLRNVGRRACRMPGLPLVTFLGRDGRPLPVRRRAPAGMHPGPVVLPVTIGAGSQVRTGLRWVSGPVFDRSRCVDAAIVRVTVAGRSSGAPLKAHLCGSAGETIGFEQAVLSRAP
jgi:hypothetical protein